MTDPETVHDAVLADLDEQIAAARRATGIAWRWLESDDDTDEELRLVDQRGLAVLTIPRIIWWPGEADRKLIVDLRNGALPQLQGRRNIIESHAPQKVPALVGGGHWWRCAGCGNRWDDCVHWRNARA